MTFKNGFENGFKVIGTPTPGLKGLVLWFKFNEGSGSVAKDSSLYNNHGTIVGAQWVDGKFDKALSFDGIDDYVEVTNSESLNIKKKLTISMWVKFFSLKTKMVLCAKFQSGKYDWLFWIDNTYPDELRFYPSSDQYKGWTTNADLQTNRWYHIVVVYDGDGATNEEKLKIYVDGEPKNMDYYGTLYSSLPAYSIPVHIGYNPGNPYYPKYLDGIIDEVRIYNRVLSEEEIQMLMYNRIGAVEAKAI